ncbi:uncharacterized protein LOC115890209 [Sitophilus oryzae]|uniref:Uncharacterized protein LOC115890209 n=1 Tax=Sitophilus oryzae TaxID=7048 RepID=A0A6J2YTT9_SITOR|nr:uncharacterized protein LOC115890209 [Sitophilus oryzae]
MYDILGTQLTGRNSEFDDDAAESLNIIIENPVEHINPVEEITHNDPNELKGVNLIEVPAVPGPSKAQHIWSHYTPDMLKTPKSIQLCPSAKKDAIKPEISSIRIRIRMKRFCENRESHDKRSIFGRIR